VPCTIGCRVSTAFGNGVSFGSYFSSPSYLSYSGPSVAYGNGWYVVAYSYYSDQHNVYILRSQDGYSWEQRGPIQTSGSDIHAYGSPVISFTKDGNGVGFFVLAWLNFPYGSGRPQSPTIDSKVYALTSNDNGQTFSNYYNNSILAPHGFDIGCRPDADACILAYPNGDGTNSIIHKTCYISYGYFVCNATGGTTSETTRVNPSLTYGNGYYLLGWRGTDSNFSLNTERKTSNDSSVPWYDKYVLSQGANAGPAMSYSGYWAEHVLYYTY
jgi:hypothetical protein